MDRFLPTQAITWMLMGQLLMINIDSCVDSVTPKIRKKWVLIVAGAKDYKNYFSQPKCPQTLSMHSASVAIVAFASIMMLYQCDDVLGREDYYYMVSFPRKDHENMNKPATGFIQIGCGRNWCILELSTLSNKTKMIMRPFKFERLTTKDVGVYEIVGPSGLALSIVSNSNIMVTCGTSAYPFFDDAFTVYPIARTDTSFVFTYTSKIRFAAIMGTEEYTSVDIIYKAANSYAKSNKISFKLERLIAYYWPGNFKIKNGSSSVIDAKSPLAVYIGFYTIQASLRPRRTYGKNFMINGYIGKQTWYRLTMVTWMNEITKKVTWKDESGHTYSRRLQIHQEIGVPPVLEVYVKFKMLVIRAEVDISVAVTLNRYGHVWKDTFELPQFFVTPNEVLLTMQCYALSVPYENPDQGDGTRMLSVISRLADKDKIRINGGPFDRWISEKKTMKGLDDTMYHGATIVHNQTLTLFVPFWDHHPVPFAIYLGSEFKSGVYMTETRGFTYCTHSPPYGKYYGSEPGSRPGSGIGSYYGWDNPTASDLGTGLPGHTFVIGSMPPEYHADGAFLTISSYSRRCTVQITDSDGTRKLTMPSFNTKSERFKLGDGYYKVPLTRIYSTYDISVIASVHHGDKYVSAFSVYPILDFDTFFLLAVPKEAAWVLVVPRKEDTALRISVHQRTSRTSQIIEMKRIAKRQHGFHWGDSDHFQGSMIRAQKPVAVYYGMLHVTGQVPSFKRYGRDFILYRMHSYARVDATVYAPACALVSWSYGGATMRRKELQCAKYCSSPTTLVINGWTVLRIVSSSNIAVLVKYKIRHFIVVPAFVTPMEFYDSEYIIRIRSSRSGNSPVAPNLKLVFIAKKTEVDLILCNRKTVSTLLATATAVHDIEVPAYEKAFCVWAGISLKHIKFMVFKPDPWNSKARNVKYALALHHDEDHYPFISFVGGKSKYELRNDEWRYGEDIKKLDACSRKSSVSEPGYRRAMSQQTLYYRERTAFVLIFLIPIVALLVGATVYSIWITKTAANPPPPAPGDEDTTTIEPGDENATTTEPGMEPTSLD